MKRFGLVYLRPIKEHYSLLHSSEGKLGRLPYGPFFESSMLGKRNKISILAHKSKVVFQGSKFLVFLNYKSALLWHWMAFMTAVKVR